MIKENFVFIGYQLEASLKVEFKCDYEKKMT